MLPRQFKRKIHTPQGHFDQVFEYSHLAYTHPPKPRFTSTQALRSCHAPRLEKLPDVPGSPSPSYWAFGIGLEAQTEKPSSDGFVAKTPNPMYSLRSSTATLHRLYVHDFLLLFLYHAARTRPCRPPYRLHQTKPTCLSITRRPTQHRPFALVLHLHQHE
jgi:hypothetical protein